MFECIIARYCLVLIIQVTQIQPFYISIFTWVLLLTRNDTKFIGFHKDHRNVLTKKNAYLCSYNCFKNNYLYFWSSTAPILLWNLGVYSPLILCKVLWPRTAVLYHKCLFGFICYREFASLWTIAFLTSWRILFKSLLQIGFLWADKCAKRWNIWLWINNSLVFNRKLVVQFGF